MRLLDPTYIRDVVDYSFGDESGLSIGGYMRPANIHNQDFMNRYRQAVANRQPYMTLFIDNMRLYRRDCYKYTAVEGHNMQWKAIRDSKVLQFAGEDLLRLCGTLTGMQFIIFTGFEDMPTDEGIWEALPDNVLAVYASNCTTWGDRVHPIPFGLQRMMAPNDYRHQAILDILHSSPVVPQRLMYINFNIGNHPTRPLLANRYAPYPWVTVHDPGMGLVYQQAAVNYYGNIRNHKFMLCPSGNAPGCECHRDIECLYMRRVPIVEDTPYHRVIFDLLKAPVLYIDNLMDITEQLLIDNDYLYQQMQEYDMSNLDIELLYNRCIQQATALLSHTTEHI